MNNQTQREYVGNAKQVNNQYGTYFQLSFSRQDLELMMSKLNEKGYVNLNMNERREPSQYGQTHSISIYERQVQQAGTQAPSNQPANQQGQWQSYANQGQVPDSSGELESDIPF